jgi:deoxyribodipyrimidine photolyase-like uncharacterized protein
MKEFCNELERDGYKTCYINWQDVKSTKQGYNLILKHHKIKSIHVVEFDDYMLEKRVKKIAQDHKIPLHIHRSPGFTQSHMNDKAARSSESKLIWLHLLSHFYPIQQPGYLFFFPRFHIIRRIQEVLVTEIPSQERTSQYLLRY